MTKVDIISGFLGAGKTTFIKELIAKVYKGEKIVLIENEFGEIGIDSRFMQNSGIEVTEMNSGCICCTLVGDFAKALKQVVDEFQPDRVIIEPSCVGKLSDVASAVNEMKDSAQVEIDSRITVVDGKKAKLHIKNFGEFFNNQIEYATTIVVSRSQMITEEKLKECVSLLRNYNREATIITTSWDKLSGDMIQEAVEHGRSLEEELLRAYQKERHHHDHDRQEHGCGHDHEHHRHDHGDEHHGHHHHEEHEEHHHEHDHDHHHEHGEDCTCGCHDHDHHHHHADEIFGSWGMETPDQYSKEDLEKILEALEDDDRYGMVLRAKGMVPCTEGGFIYFDYVPGESNIRPGKPDVTGKFCVIGSKLKEEALKELFSK